MPGMPSARGVEWKGRDDSRKRFDENFDKINWSNDKPREVVSESTSNHPETCSACGLADWCPPSCANGSEECHALLGASKDYPKVEK